MARKAVGKRRTTQREAIAEVIRAARGPLTIGQIHERARRRSPMLGLATVYRTVKLLLADDLVHAVIMSDGETRYESAHLDHHHHFHCGVCGSVFDLPGCPLPIADGTVLPEGFVVTGHEVTLHGRCPACVQGAKRRGQRRK
jgi:Fur family ferric uptake transcriptional regulator